MGEGGAIGVVVMVVVVVVRVLDELCELLLREELMQVSRQGWPDEVSAQLIGGDAEALCEQLAQQTSPCRERRVAARGVGEVYFKGGGVGVGSLQFVQEARLADARLASEQSDRRLSRRRDDVDARRQQLRLGRAA